VGRKGLLTVAVAALGVAAAAALGLYALDGGRGNAEAVAMCADAATASGARLGPLATGEVAAFQTAREAHDLSGLGFLDETGEATTLGALKGRVALVNLWATWCAPCRKEMPALDRLNAALGGDGFAVVPISVDVGSRDKPEAFLTSIETTTLPLYTDPSMGIFNEMRKRGLALGLPVTALIDENGCLLGHMNGPAEWDSREGQALIRAAIEGA
jgi:thiol-disulfide isomerase/thioredoxin